MGMYFWEGDFEEAEKPLKKAFQQFRLSHKKLIELQHAEFEMHPEKNKAYINTETDLPLYKSQQLKEMFQERVRGVQHLI